MNRQVEITTGARLHFGLLTHRAAAGPQFSGAGLMIDAPGFQVAAQQDTRDVVEGDEPFRTRAEAFVARYRAGCQHNVPPSCVPPPCHLRIMQTVPLHSGLGSGTQLGMAIARALSRLAGDDTSGAESLGRRVGRGRRSAIGIRGFDRGGFLVDDGSTKGEEIGPPAARAHFPDHWRVLLVTPPGDTGLYGESEADAFARLPGMPTSLTEQLTGILMQRLLPAVVSADFEACSESLHDFGRRVGEYFASVQGGPYASPSMCELVDHLRGTGRGGVAQTSWGPTIFVLTRDNDSAQELAGQLLADDRWNRCRFHVAAPMNTGATITTK